MVRDYPESDEADIATRRQRELLNYITTEQLEVYDGPPKGHLGGFSQDIFSALSPYCQLTGLACGVSKVMLNVMDADTMYFLGSYGHEDGVDPIVKACSASVPLEGRVCEMTIRLAPNAATTPIFCVPDLAADPVFRGLDVVSGPPYYRFYAGTPITTEAGVNIGSLAVLDQKPRQGLTRELERFLGRTASQIMNLLETRRYALEGKRATQFLRTSEAFTAGKSTVHTKQHPPTSYGLSVHEPQTRPKKGRSGSVVSIPGVSDEEQNGDQSESDDDDVQRNQTESSTSEVFARAAGLLREAFNDLDLGVEVAFTFLDTSRHHLGSTRPEDVVISSAGLQSHNSAHVSRSTIKLLLRRYPNGCLFDLEEHLCYSPTSPGTSGWVPVKPPTRFSSAELDRVAELHDVFPGAREVLFCALWDADRQSYASACFVAQMSGSSSFSATTDLPFLNSFCCSLMTECSRLEAARSARIKADFVGTISHELRSPLHGVLAGVEFLTETCLDQYQQSLASTVQGCGRVLLDTINHILDYSKINTYRKAWQAANSRTKPLKGKRPTPAAAPALLQTDVVEVASVVEEVVDTLIASQEFSQSDVSDHPSPRKASNRVQVLMEIEPGDWNFLTQPGAIRRIVMNLTGNALKYTSRGNITISLSQTAPTEILLTVADTGCGISERFIATKLYEAFAQEDVLAPGTGLGLSIVQNIVAMLGGSIAVSSVVGSGTKFTVKLPLERPMPGQQSTANTPHSGSSISSTKSNPQAAIDFLLQSKLRRIMLVISDSSLEANVEKLVTQWFGLSVVEEAADVCITDNVDMSTSSARYVICLGSLTQQRHHTDRSIEIVPTPVGPYRLARSLCAVLVRAGSKAASVRGSIDLGTIQEHPPSEPVTAGLHEVDLGDQDDSGLSRIVQATESMAFAHDSPQAQRVLFTPKIDSQASAIENGDGFPFPGQESTNGSHVNHQKAAVRQSTGKPRVLVVDDNRVNLNLLMNFLERKRKYTDVGSAEDGQQALDLFTAEAGLGHPFDIVFMDISMPVMNGFESTRAIRAWEKRQQNAAGGALIIALTGLAGSRDQAEAFDAGVDVYLTKPMSFKSVSELLENWESNQKLSRQSNEDLAREMLGESVNMVHQPDARGPLSAISE